MYIYYKYVCNYNLYLSTQTKLFFIIFAIANLSINFFILILKFAVAKIIKLALSMYLSISYNYKHIKGDAVNKREII